MTGCERTDVAEPGGASPGPRRAAVQAALDEVRPRVQAHNGDVSISAITEDGDVHLKFHGACIGCPFQPSTFGAALYRPVADVDGVREVHLDGARVSPLALERVMRLAGVERRPRGEDTTSQ
jgi:Fe-S cluster biogenesis protein NfuA